ncbi:MAG: hypothetical protein HWN79_16960 [Candidatus Lokiarchaeota archaeon]|nr:hypothetical protein [Candidatus Lokiarchaeota archaeon]
MEFAIMFQVLEGGVSEPIKWSKDNLTPDNNIIILDEGTSSLYLWYGAKQGLVSRRTALRQAESLKGHGFSVGKSIVGRDIRDLKEIDQRKIGRVLEIDELNEELQTLLNKNFKPLDDYTVTFELEADFPTTMKPKIEPKPEPKAEPKFTPEPVPEPIYKPEPIKKVTPPQPKMIRASEYDTEVETSTISEPVETKISKPTPVSTPEQPITPKSKVNLDIQAKIGFVIIGVLDHYDDIWISKKEDGGYSVEQMDGKVCEFSISEGKIKFTSDSFSGISTNVKTEIQKKFVDLSKFL